MSSVGNSLIFMHRSDSEAFINSAHVMLIVTFWGYFSHGAVHLPRVTLLAARALLAVNALQTMRAKMAEWLEMMVTK